MDINILLVQLTDLNESDKIVQSKLDDLFDKIKKYLDCYDWYRYKFIKKYGKLLSYK